MIQLLAKAKTWLLQQICSHTFALEQLQLTEISEPEKPESNNIEEWEQYFEEYWDGDWNTKRVVWPCYKCGKKFYAHCGLDISPSKGPAFRLKEN